MLPRLPYQENASRQQIINFKGLNYGHYTQDGELVQSKNLATHQFPGLSQRYSRQNLEYTNVIAAWSKDSHLLLVIDDEENDRAYMQLDGQDITSRSDGTRAYISRGEKQIIAVSDKICIFPDKVFIYSGWMNDTTLEADYQLYNMEMNYSAEAPEGGSLMISQDLETGNYVFNFSVVDQSERYYGRTEDLTEKEAETSDVRIEDLFKPFDNGTVVKVRLEYGARVDSGTEPVITDRLISEGYATVAFYTTDGYNSGEITPGQSRYTKVYKLEFQTGFEALMNVADSSFALDLYKVNITMDVPDFEFFCEVDNRLWGCHDNIIYASSLGNPRCFEDFSGLSTDSFQVAVASNGAFTGCCRYGSNPLFFKEHQLHKIMGSYPEEYQLYTYTIPGIKAGSHRSAVVISETLFYHGVHGIYAYSGAVPDLISEEFGTHQYSNAVAGTDSKVYYVSMRDDTTMEWNLFTFDTEHGIWLREDNTQASQFLIMSSLLTCIDAGRESMWQATRFQNDTDIEWEAELAPFDWVTPEWKQYQRIYLQVTVETGSRLEVYMREDNNPYRRAYALTATNNRNVSIPVVPNHCDTLQVKLVGHGPVLIKQVMREYVISGERGDYNKWIT